MQALLKRTLEVIVSLLQTGDKTLCNTLTRIFDGSRQFYLDTVLDMTRSTTSSQFSRYGRAAVDATESNDGNGNGGGSGGVMHEVGAQLKEGLGTVTYAVLPNFNSMCLFLSFYR